MANEDRANRALEVLKALEDVPFVHEASATRVGDSLKVTAGISLPSHLKKTWTAATCEFLVNHKGEILHTTALQPAPVGLTMQSASPDDSIRLLFMTKEDQRIIEVYHKDFGRVAEMDVTDQHDAFRSGDNFGKPAWRADSKQVVYTAEELPPYHDDTAKPPGHYTYRPHGGRGMSTVREWGLYLLDLQNLNKIQVTRLTDRNTLTGVSFGSPVLSPESNDEKLVLFATGGSLLVDGRRLGMSQKSTGKEAVYRLAFNPAVKYKCELSMVSEQGKASRSPRVGKLPNGEHVLVYISRRQTGPHNACAQIYSSDLYGRNRRLLVDIVQDGFDTASEGDPFPGLYTYGFLDSPFLEVAGPLGKHTYVAMDTDWRCQRRLVTVRLSDGKLESHHVDGFSNFEFRCTDGGDTVVGVRSSLAAIPEFVMGTARLEDDVLEFEWKRLGQWQLINEESVPRLSASLLTLPTNRPTEILLLTHPAAATALRNCAIATSTADFGRNDGEHPDTIPPLVLWPHGGPNNVYTTAFNAQAYALASAGFSIALVNYPGSSGYGERYFHDLADSAGKMDVAACAAAMEYLIQNGLASRDKGKRFLWGISHGGFLAAQLSARFGECFDAVVMANPYIDGASCFTTTDTPEWALKQNGVRYSLDKPKYMLSQDEFAKLEKASALPHLQRAFDEGKTIPPTMLLIGESDRRIPPTQGYNWYHALKRHGQKVDCLSFPAEDHSLDGFETRQTVLQASIEFFTKYASLI